MQLRFVFVAGVVLLAGCSLAQDQGSGRDDNLSGTQTSDIETPRGASETNTINYSRLSSTEQEFFKAAVDGQARAGPKTEYMNGMYFSRDVTEPFFAYDYVLKNQTYYELSHRMGLVAASYAIHAERADSPVGASVIPLQNLSTDVRQPVRWAIENGSYESPPGKWNSLPAELDSIEYVTDDGDTYRLGHVVGDHAADIWTARAVN